MFQNLHSLKHEILKKSLRVILFRFLYFPYVREVKYDVENQLLALVVTKVLKGKKRKIYYGFNENIQDGHQKEIIKKKIIKHLNT